MPHFTFRRQPPSPLRTAILGRLGAMLAVAAIRLTQDMARPLSQPMNVVPGHALARIVGVGALLATPHGVWIAAIAVGPAITGMAIFRATHEPAGATALVSYARAPSAGFLTFPMLSGARALVLLGSVYHRLTGMTYPAQPPERA